MSDVSTVEEMVDQVTAALEALRETVAAIKVNGRELGSAVRWEPGAKVGDPLQVIIVPTTFRYENYGEGLPTEMVVQLFCTVPVGDRATINLITLGLAVGQAVEANTGAAVTGSDTGTWRVGAVELPAQIVTVEVPL